ncbi:MAG TPA: hypothetical protein GXZ58_01330 [Bacilli bacterium]|nr:hypothetical protein [Bacilli bacterium]
MTVKDIDLNYYLKMNLFNEQEFDYYVIESGLKTRLLLLNFDQPNFDDWLDQFKAKNDSDESDLTWLISEPSDLV